MKKILFLFLILLSSCTITSNVVIEPFSEVNVYFCPQDDCQNKILHLIDDSSEIKCAFYELNLPELIESLKQKNAEVIIEDSQYEGEFQTGKSFALMHNKFCVFDNHIVMTGSMNPTIRGNYYNNNNLLFIDSVALANNFLKEFEELKNNQYGKGNRIQNSKIQLGNTKIENYFCPEDNCKLQVINALNTANNSIYFMVFSFTDEDIGNLLYNKEYLGLDVKGVLEKRQLGTYSRYEDLKEFSIIDENPYTMHHKVFIIDNKTIITGSYNPTKNANENNDENILIIHDKNIAKKYLEEFEKLYYNNFEEKSNIKITKVVYDVPGSDKGKEYVEIQNTGIVLENLNYYFISNNKTSSKLNGTININETKRIFPKFSLTNKQGVVQLKKHIYVVDSFSWDNS
ncbi:hypothetical protein HN789_05145 [archaeon]|jgi:phosphatidylserine/phosphatidylglycerophosphate/cardiolipin synthase-like enzyme|nr:hypothetical protein [archaeon]MBT4022897.1 hypothetical protein [archaeon]MBT4272544.1 hypothetical protein [archaeon]MBT4460388.1 hypothetical protein [archaeon]MBT4859019.1 hypothetical protein [archaeon]